MGGDQDRGVQDPVLLGPTQLLPLQEEDTGIPPVGHEEVRHGAPLADLTSSKD